MEQSPLWRRTYGESLSDPIVARLVTSLRGARERASLLTSRIVDSLPGLTLHDISHLDALWGVAGTIAGDDYTLNPLDCYLFGTAALLHDAALCHEAYSGGAGRCKGDHSMERCLQPATHQPRQGRSQRCRLRGSKEPPCNPSRQARYRPLVHRRRRPMVHHRTMPISATQYGPLIGQIASSHHWDIEDVANKAFAIPRRCGAGRPSFIPIDVRRSTVLWPACYGQPTAGHMNSVDKRAPTTPSPPPDPPDRTLSSKARLDGSEPSSADLSYNHDHPTQFGVGIRAHPQLRFLRPKHLHGGWHSISSSVQLNRELKQACDAVLQTAEERLANSASSRLHEPSPAQATR